MESKVEYDKERIHFMREGALSQAEVHGNVAELRKTNTLWICDLADAQATALAAKDVRIAELEATVRNLLDTSKISDGTGGAFNWMHAVERAEKTLSQKGGE
jgi:hypothetical protein